MEKLFEHINAKSSSGIPYSDAVQLMLCIYCTLDVLPKEFHTIKLTRQELANLFSKLSAVGKIVLGPKTDTAEVGTLSDKIIRQDHWDGLIKKLLLGQLSLDDSFLSRVAIYV